MITWPDPGSLNKIQYQLVKEGLVSHAFVSDVSHLASFRRVLLLFPGGQHNSSKQGTEAPKSAPLPQSWLTCVGDMWTDHPSVPASAFMTPAMCSSVQRLRKQFSFGVSITSKNVWDTQSDSMVRRKTTRGMCDDKRQQPDVDDMSGSWGWVNPGDPSGSVPSARKFHAAVQSNNGMLVAHLQCSGSWGGVL